jgi:predicted esterase
MNRRTFLSLGAAGAMAALHRTRAAAQQYLPKERVPYGERRLRISEEEPDGLLYVPKSYTPETPMPLLVMLHGLSGTAQSVRFVFPYAEEYGVIVIAPDSRRMGWGAEVPGFDDDSAYIAEAYREVVEFLNVDRSRTALGGVSDGATYALAMGLAYGDRFTHLMIFATGMMGPLRKRGKPKIFLAHGLNDTQMPIDRTARRIVPPLQSEGYDITYREYDGGHGAPRELVGEAFHWFARGSSSKP